MSVIIIFNDKLYVTALKKSCKIYTYNNMLYVLKSMLVVK